MSDEQEKEFTEEETQLLMAGATIISLLRETTGADVDECCTLLHTALGKPKPAARAKALVTKAMNACKDEVANITIDFSNIPKELKTDAEKLEFLLHKLLEALREKQGQLGEEGCGCSTCVAREKLLAKFAKWEEDGVPLIDHRDEILQDLVDSGVRSKALELLGNLGVLQKPGAPAQAEGEGVIPFPKGRVLH